MKIYSEDILKEITSFKPNVILTFKDNTKIVGRLEKSALKYLLMPLNINESSILFTRSHIKQIVSLNTGLVYPKSYDDKLKILDIIELSELLNEAGYEFL